MGNNRKSKREKKRKWQAQKNSSTPTELWYSQRAGAPSLTDAKQRSRNRAFSSVSLDSIRQLMERLSTIKLSPLSTRPPCLKFLSMETNLVAATTLSLRSEMAPLHRCFSDSVREEASVYH